VDAFRDNLVVSEPDLRSPTISRWPGFAPGALAAGVRAVFGLPLRVGAIPVGALDLYRDSPGPLTAEQQADAAVLADLVAETLLVMQADPSSGEPEPGLGPSFDFRAAVYQAAGMVAVQLDVDVDVALIRLRGYAFGHDRPLLEVAHEVVARRLRLE
jgi:hypothetical protein